MKLKYLLILIFLSGSLAQAAIIDQNQLSLAFISDTRNESLSIENNDQSRKIEYQPNLGGAIGLLISYDWLSLTIMTSKALPPPDGATKGDSVYDDVRGGGFLGDQKQFYLFGGYARYNGFYIENSHDLDPSLPADKFYTYDLELKKFQLMLTYAFSPEKYSMAAAQTQLTRQTESGGSWKARALVEHLQIKNNSQSLIPAAVQGQFGAQGEYQGGEFTTVGALGGYGYNWVFDESWFIHGSLMFGAGLATNHYYYASSAATSTQLNLLSDGGLNFGYNGESFFGSFNVVVQATSFETGSITNYEQTLMGNFTLGYRFE